MKKALPIASLTVAAALGLLLVVETDAGATAALDTFKVDAVHSSLIFRIRYANTSTFFGRFNEFSGTFSVDEKDLSKSQFDVRVSTGSVDTGNEKRDGHLSSPDFFSAKQYPEISFVSKKVKPGKGKELKVTGDLTLRGVTKSVVADVTYGGQAKGRGGVRAGLDGKLTIRREEFGVKFGEGMLGSEVTIEMGLSGLKQ